MKRSAWKKHTVHVGLLFNDPGQELHTMYLVLCLATTLLNVLWRFVDAAGNGFFTAMLQNRFIKSSSNSHWGRQWWQISTLLMIFNVILITYSTYLSKAVYWIYSNRKCAGDHTQFQIRSKVSLGSIDMDVTKSAAVHFSRCNYL